MELTISTKFINYQEPTAHSKIKLLSLNVYNEDLFTSEGNVYRRIIKNNIFEIPTQSTHIIKFSKNRKDPFIDSYVLKVEKPASYVEEAESYFEIAGLYLNESVLQDSFLNIPNDMVDYENNPTGEDPEYEDYTDLTRLRYD